MITEIGWTSPLAAAHTYIDPSGVQSASTTLQALLFPGMSTQTARLRYISLFAAARYYRMEAGKEAEDQLSLLDYLRRFEALIAVCSVRHHPHERVLLGIVGSDAGVIMGSQGEFELKTGLQNPPYNIYRGTLYNLGIFNTSIPSDPLFEQAKSLARSWDISAANAIGEDMRKGVLASRSRRETVDEIASAFCLCKIPEGSEEQRALIQILLALGKDLQIPPSFEDEDALVAHSETCRSLAWRFLLELVLDSDDNRLGTHYTMVYLLTHNLVPSTEHPALQFCLQVWRWIAARTFFERGWTQIFSRTIQLLSQEREGLSRMRLHQKIQEDYLTRNLDEPITQLIQEVAANCNSQEWLLERYDERHYRDFLLCIYIGLFMAVEDKKRYNASILESLWEREPVPFSREYIRFENGVRNGITTSNLWAEIGEESLTQHFQIALRKMSSGNPDTLLVDFDNGQWRVPEKALHTSPERAEGSTRLDIGLQWAQQLGLIRSTGKGCFVLTDVGLDCCVEWDQEYRR